jgi:hypothetical protein
MRPVRPSPVITSSAISTMSCSSQIARTPSKYPGDGACPGAPAPPTGSMMNAEMRSAPTAATTSRRSSATPCPWTFGPFSATGSGGLPSSGIATRGPSDSSGAYGSRRWRTPPVARAVIVLPW